MGLNSDKPSKWKEDIAKSVDFYNDWFFQFAPKAYRDTRKKTTEQVEEALRLTGDLRDISPSLLREHPNVVETLRMTTAPPIALDRLVGLAKVSKTLVTSMEDKGKIPERMAEGQVEEELRRIGDVIARLADEDIFPWLSSTDAPTEPTRYRAATIVADRLCGSVANPIIRNAQEKRQLETIAGWLHNRAYSFIPPGQKLNCLEMKPGTFAFRLIVPVMLATTRQVNIPVDVAVMPKKPGKRRMPILIEAKSAGDYTNVNKRRKEEAAKMAQLRVTYGKGVTYILFLCGYFDTGYLGYEAAEGIDWVWEHRIDDLEKLGL